MELAAAARSVDRAEPGSGCVVGDGYMWGSHTITTATPTLPSVMLPPEKNVVCCPDEPERGLSG